MKFLLAKCVWGRDYVRTLLTVNLPTLLAPGNLPAASARADVEHVIYTTEEDAAVIRDHPAHRALASVVPCRIERLDDGGGRAGGYLGNIARMNEAHNRILTDCETQERAWLFDQPDHVWGDGSLDHLVRRALAGVRCVMFAGIRTVLEDMTPALAMRQDGVGGPIRIGNRDLLRLAMDHMHIHDMVRFWGMPIATVWPHHVSWRVGPDAFVRRAFFGQPFLVSRPEHGARAERSVDMHFADQAFPDLEGVEFVRDTDDFLVVEVSTRVHVQDHNLHPITLPLTAAWAARNATPYQLRCFAHPIRFHGSDVPSRRWRAIERYSERILDAVVALRPLHDAHAAAAGRPALATLMGRLLRHEVSWKGRALPERVTLLVPDEASLARLLSVPPDSLAALAADHMLAGDAPLERLLADGGATTLSGRRLDATRRAGGVWIGNRRVTGADLFIGGVRSHELDGSFAPETPSPFLRSLPETP